MAQAQLVQDRLMVPTPIEAKTGAAQMTAEDVKDALRRRHPGQTMNGMVAQWTCIEEWLGIDLLALNAWQKADVIGYEVKVSRSDMRRELLRPDKRATALERTTEFYFAVPQGLLTDDEIAWEEPEWEPGDFERTTCPGIPAFGPPHRFSGEPRYGGRCTKARYVRAKAPSKVTVPKPVVVTVPEFAAKRWEGETDEHYEARQRREITYVSLDDDVTCPTCKGRGYTETSRVERDAPTLWVPRDVGLVTISKRGCRVVKKSPKRKNPAPIATSRQHLNDLVRWVSHRPDPRHAPLTSKDETAPPSSSLGAGNEAA